MCGEERGEGVWGGGRRGRGGTEEVERVGSGGCTYLERYMASGECPVMAGRGYTNRGR